MVMEKFFLGDCREILKQIAPQSIALIVTSPPYNTGKSYETPLGFGEYEKFSREWCVASLESLSETGALWLNLGYMKISRTETLPLTYLFYHILKSLGLHLIQEIVWHYEGGMPYKKRFSHRTERWQWWVCDSSHYTFNLDEVRDLSINRTNDVRNNPLGKNPTDYWYYNRVVGGCGASIEKTLHPCQFPVNMIKRIIKACSNQGDIILDPFGGSGTTAIAAYSIKRDFISIEKSQEYHKISQTRLANFKY